MAVSAPHSAVLIAFSAVSGGNLISYPIFLCIFASSFWQGGSRVLAVLNY